MQEAASELKLIYGEASMIGKEFARINLMVSMNLPLEKAWESFALRTGSEDILNYARVLKIAKRSGGDLKAIASHTADIIGDKLRIKEEILTMTAGKQFEQKIMNLIPALIVVYIDRTSPGFFDPLYHGLTGRLIMTGCLAVYAASILLADRILRIEV